MGAGLKSYERLLLFGRVLEPKGRHLGRKDVHEMGEGRRNWNWHRDPEAVREPVLILVISKPRLWWCVWWQEKLSQGCTHLALEWHKPEAEIQQQVQLPHSWGEPAEAWRCAWGAVEPGPLHPLSGHKWYMASASFSSGSHTAYVLGPMLTQSFWETLY